MAVWSMPETSKQGGGTPGTEAVGFDAFGGGCW